MTPFVGHLFLRMTHGLSPRSGLVASLARTTRGVGGHGLGFLQFVS